jgi:hypothetical protein
MVPVVEVVIQMIASRPRPHLLGAPCEGVRIRPPALRRLTVRLPHVAHKIKREQQVACLDVCGEVELGHQECHVLPVINETNVVVVLHHPLPNINVPLARDII